MLLNVAHRDPYVVICVVSQASRLAIPFSDAGHGRIPDGRAWAEKVEEFAGKVSTPRLLKFPLKCTIHLTWLAESAPFRPVFLTRTHFYIYIFIYLFLFLYISISHIKVLTFIRKRYN
jgi:hypothetical protein